MKRRTGRRVRQPSPQVLEPAPCDPGIVWPYGYSAADEARAILHQINLERTVGDWVPPEARTS